MTADAATRYLRRADGRLERLCEHGVGHTVAVPAEHAETDAYWIHGCDGCCAPRARVLSLAHNQSHNEYLRHALANRLEEMRAACLSAPHGCPGYHPYALTAEGMIDEGRLRRAIERSDVTVVYEACPREEHRMCWQLYRSGLRCRHNPDLATAYLEMVEE